MNYDTESVLLLDRNSRLVSTVLTLDDTPRKLNAIWELAFTMINPLFILVEHI